MGWGERRVLTSDGCGSEAAASQGQATCILTRASLLAGHEILVSVVAKGKVPKACSGARAASSCQCTLVVLDLGLCLCREGT